MQDPDELASRAAQLAADAKWAEAQPLFRELLTNNPHDVQSLAGLGIAVAHQNRPEEAIAPLERASQLAADDWRIWHALGIVYRSSARFEQAADALAKANALNPADVEVRFDYTHALLLLGRYN